MPILGRSRRALAVGLANAGHADEIVDIIDAGTGTLTSGCVRTLRVALGKQGGSDFATVVNAASGAIAANTIRRLKLCCADGSSGTDINAGIIANA